MIGRNWGPERLLRKPIANDEAADTTAVAEPNDALRIPSEPPGTTITRPPRREPVNLVTGTSSVGLKVHQHLAEAEPQEHLLISSVSF